MTTMGLLTGTLSPEARLALWDVRAMLAPATDNGSKEAPKKPRPVVLGFHESDVVTICAVQGTEEFTVATVSNDGVVKIWHAMHLEGERSLPLVPRKTEASSIGGAGAGTTSSFFNAKARTYPLAWLAGSSRLVSSVGASSCVWERGRFRIECTATLDTAVESIAVGGTLVAVGDAVGRVHLFGFGDIVLRGGGLLARLREK